MKKGWIKIHRQFVYWEWYTDSNMVHVFLHLLISANHADGRWKGNEVKRGQLIIGRKRLSVATGLSERQVRTCLKKLEKSGEIAIKPTNAFSLVTIIKYEFYQKKDKEVYQQNSQRITNKRPTRNQQIATNKKEKNVNNDKKKEYSAEIFNFYNEIIFFFPEKMRPKNSLQKHNWLEVIEKLVVRENYSFERILKIIKHFRKDDFWSGNFLSLPKLLKKNKDGLRYIDVFNEKLKTQKPHCQISTDSMEKIINNKKRLDF